MHAGRVVQIVVMLGCYDLQCTWSNVRMLQPYCNYMKNMCYINNVARLLRPPISFLTTTFLTTTGTFNRHTDIHRRTDIQCTTNQQQQQQQQQQQHYSTTTAAEDVIPLAARVTQSTTCTRPVTTPQQMHCTRLHAVVRPCTALPLIQSQRCSQQQ
jgi:hypothetical protein